VRAELADVEAEVGKSSMPTAGGKMAAVAKDLLAALESPNLFSLERPSPSQLRVLMAMQQLRQAASTAEAAEEEFADADLEA
jgi:hypothetical protein